ncbi:uncharacterized protein [Diadema setosum]|uniref:uncharacterized protein n=1 Tax=Diadema setosum TaxID=31175 RepID=UPI003B3B0AF6
MLAVVAPCFFGAGAMAMCHELPVLPLDRYVPPHVLERRGAISFSSGSSLFNSLPRLERRGGISFDRADKTALYVRMLGDVIVRGKLMTTDPLPVRRGSVPENECKAPQIFASNNIRRTSLQTPTVVAITPSPTITTASQAKQSKADTENRGGDTPKLADAHHRTPPTVLMDSAYHGQTQQMLNNIGQWDFNIFKFDEISRGHSLRLVLFHLFEEYGLQQHFNLDRYKLMRSFDLIEEAYYAKSKNPYHNSMHAADVCQAMHCYLQEEKLRQALTPLEVMGALLGSAMHDLDHPGVNQKYMVNSKHHLAQLYQNASVLENHHWRVGISILHETGLLDHLPPSQWKKFVDHIRSLILATDIARQQEFLSEFQRQLDKKDFSLKRHETRKFIMQIALKCADICNPCRQWQITEQWGNLVSEEFFRQGDQEKLKRLPVSMNCDRVTTTIPQIQCGFIGFVVEPLFSNWARFLATDLSQEMLHNMHENKKVWTERRNKEKQKEEEEKEAVQKEAAVSQTSAIHSPTSKTDSPSQPEENLEPPPKPAEENAAKSAEFVEPESKLLKLSSKDDASVKAKESHVLPRADRHKPRAIRETGHARPHQAHTEKERPLSAVLSPKVQRALHRTIDVTLSDSTAMSAHSQSADNLRSASSVSAVSMRSALGAKEQDARSPKVNKRVKSATENMLQGSYVGNRQLDFSLRLHRSPNTLRKNIRFDDPWEKIEKSPRSPTVDARSPLGSPREVIESPLLQRANPSLRCSHPTAGLHDGSLRQTEPPSAAIPKLGHGINNNLDFAVPVELKSTSHLHHNMSHNKQHDRSEIPHWPERGLHMYSEHNSILQRNSKHFMKTALSPSSGHRDLAGVLEQRTKATPTSLLVRPTEGCSSTRRLVSGPTSPPASIHARREGYSVSLLAPGEGKDGVREKGSPFIQKKMVERGRRKDLDVPVISSGSLSPRVPPRGDRSVYFPSSPPSGQTPTSPPYSVPAALGPLLQDFTSSQLASIARRRQHMQEGDNPAPAGGPLGDRSPRVTRHEARGGASSSHDGTDLS